MRIHVLECEDCGLDFEQRINLGMPIAKTGTCKKCQLRKQRIAYIKLGAVVAAILGILLLITAITSNCNG